MKKIIEKLDKVIEILEAKCNFDAIESSDNAQDKSESKSKIKYPDSLLTDSEISQIESIVRPYFKHYSGLKKKPYRGYDAVFQFSHYLNAPNRAEQEKLVSELKSRVNENMEMGYGQSGFSGGGRYYFYKKVK